MKTVKKPVGELTVAELLQFAELHGLEVDKGSKKPALLAAIETAGIDIETATLEIETDDDSVQATTQQKAAKPAKGAAKQKVDPRYDGMDIPRYAELDANGRYYVTVYINNEEKGGGDQPVPVSVNGSAMFIERGKDQRIPLEYFKALMLAVELRYRVDKEGRKIEPPEEVPSFPVRVVA